MNCFQLRIVLFLLSVVLTSVPTRKSEGLFPHQESYSGVGTESWQWLTEFVVDVVKVVLWSRLACGVQL